VVEITICLKAFAKRWLVGKNWVALEVSRATGRLKYNNFTGERPWERLCTWISIVGKGDVSKGRGGGSAAL
jgi:hypothetical protein